MRLPTPQPPDERGTHAGRPYWLWMPSTPPPWPAMVILHGADSGKETHADFGRLCAASGWVAVSFDQRGNGEGVEPMVPAAADDPARFAAMLAEREGVDPARICVRGSSMGGFFAIHAAAASDAFAGVIAICPAEEQGLRRGFREGRFEMRADADALDAWLGEHELAAAAERLGSKPLILLHARGDEQVPFAVSEELYERTAEPRKLVLLPGGHHRSIQHDAELQGVALRWLERALGTGG
jgi:fermentation-respiration switch protein FrsA (DUF1100 family)